MPGKCVHFQQGHTTIHNHSSHFSEPGYVLSSASPGHMFCQQQGWMGMEPYCELDPNADRETTPIKTTERTYEDPYEDCEEDHGCEYMCKMIDNVPTCTCQSGYEIEDVTTCVDIDECYENNGGCQSTCVNKPGTFQCNYYHSFQLLCIIFFVIKS